MTLEFGAWQAVGQGPQAGDAIGSGGEQKLAIRVEGRAADGDSLRDGFRRSVGFRVPDSDIAIRGGGDDLFPVRAEGRAHDAVAVAFGGVGIFGKYPQNPTAADIPEGGGAGFKIRGDDAGAIGAELRVVDRVLAECLGKCVFEQQTVARLEIVAGGMALVPRRGHRSPGDCGERGFRVQRRAADQPVERTDDGFPQLRRIGIGSGEGGALIVGNFADQESAGGIGRVAQGGEQRGEIGERAVIDFSMRRH